MGSSESTMITTDFLVQEIKNIRSSLSARDRKLFNHAKFALAEETASLDSVEMFIDFEDRDGLTIKIKNVRNPTGRIFVGYDENDKPKYVWERKGIWRATKQFFVDNFSSLRQALNSAVLAITGGERKAITN